MSMPRVVARIVCRWRGHDYGSVVYLSPSVLTCCRRCGRDIQGRTFEDLEPMTDDDFEFLESFDLMEQ